MEGVEFKLFERQARALERIAGILEDLLEVAVSTQQDLDAAIAALLTEVSDAVAALKAAAPPDLTNEVTNVETATQNLAAALAPPAAPAPAAPDAGSAPATDNPQPDAGTQPTG